MKGAWKVGLLVVAFVGLLIAGYGILGKALWPAPRDTYYAVFADVAGLNSGAKVRLAGVRVGEVTEVALASPTEARLTLSLEQGVQIPEGSRVVIPASLIGFGDQAVDIVPPPGSVRLLVPGATLVGTKGSPLEGILPDFSGTMTELNKTLVAFRDLVEDRELRGKVDELLTTSEKTLSQFGSLAGSANSMLVQNRSSIERAMREGAAAMEEVRKGAALASALLAEQKWSEQADQLLTELNATAAKSQELIASLHEFVNDPVLRESMNTSLQNVEKMTDTGTRIAANAETMTESGVVIAKNGEVLSEKAIELADKASEIADEAKEVVKRLQGLFERLPSGNPIGDIGVGLDISSSVRHPRFRTDIGIDIPFQEATLTAGLWDAFESNKITLQYGRPLNASTRYRAGIYASKPGVGVDYALAPNLGLRGDLYDLNSPRFDLRARYSFGRGFEAFVGVDGVLRENLPIIGIGIRR